MLVQATTSEQDLVTVHILGRIRLTNPHPLALMFPAIQRPITGFLRPSACFPAERLEGILLFENIKIVRSIEIGSFLTTHVAERSRRARRASRVGGAISRIERARGAADTGGGKGVPIRPEPDWAGSPLPPERALKRDFERNDVSAGDQDM